MSFIQKVARVTATIFFASGLCCLGAYAEFHAAQASAQANTNEGFVLGEGDQVAVRVADLQELDGKSYRIDPGGGFDLPLIGRVQAAGQSLAQLRSLLTARLAKYITSPSVTVNLLEGESRPVSVIGEVNSPGVHQMRGSQSLLQALAQAGGIKADAGPRVIVTRQVQQGRLSLPGETLDATGRFSTANVSLNDLLASRHPAENITVMPDDVISVPKGDVVYVVGDVRRAGGFPLASNESISLLQALSLAEGLGPDASTAHAKIIRPVSGSGGQHKEIAVDVKAIFAGRAADVSLFANDILFIPNSAAKSGSRRAVEAILQVATGVAIYAR